MNLQIQFLTLSVMAGSGAFMGVLFDVYRVLSGQLRPPRWLVPLLDIGYWAVATLFVFRALLYSNDGQVRMYVFLGLLFGVWLYFRLLSRPTIASVLLCIRLFKALVRLLARTIEIVIIKPVLLLYRLVIVLFGFLWALSIFLGKIVLQLLYPFFVLGRFLLRPLLRRLHIPERWNRFSEWCGKAVQAVKRLFGRNG